MAWEEMKKVIVKTIADALGKEVGDIDEESHLIHDLGADSLDMVELVMQFEEEYNIEVPDEEAESLTTVQKILGYFKNLYDKGIITFQPQPA